MSRSSVCVAILLACGASRCSAITVVSSAQSGPNAAAMAGTLVHAGSFYTVISGSESTTINAAGNPTSNLRAMGSFSNGVTAAGTLLPAANQNTAGNAQYAGGIDINSGICLCTGLIADNDPLVTGVPAGFGVGVEGPNNGQPTATAGVDGELDAELGKPRDADFITVIPPVGVDDGDASVLRFKITLSKPGVLRINFVHASDEFPRFPLATYNDTPLVFVGDANGQNMKNFILFRDSSGMDKTLSLSDLRTCGLLQGNLVAPSPASLPISPHANVGTALHFNHEFGGFTGKLTRETCDVYPPGVYTIKLVIQDVGDDNLDSATFFEGSSLKLYHFLPADFDLDGDVDGADFLIWQQNYAPGTPGKKFVQGDASGDGIVSTTDLNILSANWGATGGQKNLAKDFNRDGVVDGADFLIWQRGFGLHHCASRFEGDADGDGDVDSDDQPLNGSGQIVTSCGGAPMQMMVGGDESAAEQSLETELEARDSDPADANEDGVIDYTDVELWLERAE